MDDQSLDERTHFGRRFGVLLILVLVGLGSAAVAYEIGLTRGLALAGAEAGAALTPPPYYGYYGYYGPRPWGFGLFGPLLFFALWFVAIRALVWRGPWHRGWRGGPLGGTSRFDEWHRQAHERMKNDSPVAVTGDANR